MIRYILGILLIAGIIILIMSLSGKKKFKKKKKEYLEQAKVQAAKAYLNIEIKAISQNFVKEMRKDLHDFVPNSHSFKEKEEFIDIYLQSSRSEKQKYAKSKTFIMFYKVLQKRLSFENEPLGLYVCWYLLQYASIEYYGGLFAKEHSEIATNMSGLNLKDSVRAFLMNINTLKKGDYYGVTDSFGQAEPISIPKKLISVFVFFLLKTEKFENEKNFDTAYAEKMVYALLQEVQEELEVEFAEQRLSKS